MSQDLTVLAMNQSQKENIFRLIAIDPETYMKIFKINKTESISGNRC